MKIVLLKAFSAVALSGLALITFMLGQVPLVEGRHLFDPYIDTEFARDYTPEKFDQIRLGMTVEEAIQIIGPPLNEAHWDPETLFTQYNYTNDGKSRNEFPPRFTPGDFAWYRSSFDVDSTHTIVRIDKGWSYD